MGVGAAKSHVSAPDPVTHDASLPDVSPGAAGGTAPTVARPTVDCGEDEEEEEEGEEGQGAHVVEEEQAEEERGGGEAGGGGATPLLAELSRRAHSGDVALHFPGHKRGAGAPRSLVRALGCDVFSHDLPELPELDNLFAPEGVIAAAQARAAKAFGAAHTFFLVNGSTVGVQAAVAAACRPGDVLVLPRNAHQSAFAAAVVSGAVPEYVLPDFDSQWGFALGVRPEAVAAAIQRAKERLDAVVAKEEKEEEMEASSPSRKRIGAVLVTSPTYHGVASDVRAIAAVCCAHGVPLIVDEAHGAHFGFLQNAFPTPALAAGANVVVQSTHKVLGSLTQSAMLHVAAGAGGVAGLMAVEADAGARNRVTAEAVATPLQLLQSSSPSYLLLASLDGAAAQAASPGFRKALRRAVTLARAAAEEIATVPGLKVFAGEVRGSTGGKGQERSELSTDSLQPEEGGRRRAEGVGGEAREDIHSVDRIHTGTPRKGISRTGQQAASIQAAQVMQDPLRLTVGVSGLGLSGFEVDDILRERFGVVAELPSLTSLTFAVSAGTSAMDMSRLTQALRAVAAEHWHPGRGNSNSSSSGCGVGDNSGNSDRTNGAFSPHTVLPEVAMSPRNAFFAESEAVEAAAAPGRISAALLCPYPPGIPVLVPGEVITVAAVKLLHRVVAEGGSVSGARDANLRTFSVVKR